MDVRQFRIGGIYVAVKDPEARQSAAEKYTKPVSGIPNADLASNINTSLGKADTAYQLPQTGLPSTDMAEAVQTSLGKADTATQPGDLATVATSGSYTDLLNTPDGPTSSEIENVLAEVTV